MKPETEQRIVLSIEQARALREALEEYMRADSDRRRWNAADVALVPLRGGPYSNENRRLSPPAPDPLFLASETKGAE